MTSTVPTTAAATHRRLRLRCCPGLEFFPQDYGGTRYWTVKDPVAARYYQLSEEEYAILSMLDGRASLDSIRRRFERRFAPLQLPADRLHEYLGRLHECGLVLADAPGQGQQLRKRHRLTRRRELLAGFSNILALRFPGIDPQPLLDRLSPWCRWAMRPWGVAVCLLLAAAALAGVLLRFDAVASRLPDFRAFFGPRNFFWLAGCLAVAKVLHELGHALLCRHFGCRCRQIGVMLLVFTPCLYCDISDAWTLPDKWRRIAIAAGGIYVEVMLATAGTFLWWITAPGLLNSVCLNLMFICSVNTLLLNGNPLLRYDGYYVFADWVETPNLWERSRAIVRRALGRLCLGFDAGPRRAVPETRPGLLAAYGVASMVYRPLVVVLILAFLFRLLHPLKLDLLFHALALAAVVGLFGVPAFQLARFFSDAAMRRRMQRSRAVLSGLLLVSLVLLLGLVPLPCRVRAPAMLDVEGASQVYVRVPGRLVEVAAAGDVLRRGDPLARLENLEVRFEVERLATQCRRQELRVAALESRRAHDPAAAAELPPAREALADLQRQGEARRRDADRLDLTAPCGGTVLPPPRRAEAAEADGRLPQWTGTPLDAVNRDCYLQTGTVLCRLGDPRRMEAVLYVAQEQIDLVRNGDPVTVRLDQSPPRKLAGRVAEISKLDLEVVPRALSASGDLPIRPAAGGPKRPLKTLYQVRVALDDREADLLIGARGRAGISVGPRSLLQRLLRYLAGTLRMTV